MRRWNRCRNNCLSSQINGQSGMATSVAHAPKIEFISTGTPYEMGVAQGTTLREKIQLGRHELDRLEVFRNERPWWLPPKVFLRFAEHKVSAMVAPGFTKKYPEMNDRLKGISHGAQVPLRSLYLLNGFESLMASVEGRYYIQAALGGCSAVAVRGKSSASGQPVIARNFDYLTVVVPFYAFRESRPKNGLRALEFFTAPSAGTIDGMNEAGLCITYNYALAVDKPAKHSGLISMAISEALAKFTTVAEAAEWIASRPRWGGGLLMLIDATGDIASLELSSTCSELRRPADGEDFIFHTNCYAAPKTCSVQVPLEAIFNRRAPRQLRGQRVLGSACCRRERLSELLPNSGPHDSNSLTKLLGDHGPNGEATSDTVCMHGDYWNTTASLQWFPAERKVRVSYTSTCQAEYVELRLN
jgi:predicted choloylglycine hydrolase